MCISHTVIFQLCHFSGVRLFVYHLRLSAGTQETAEFVGHTQDAKYDPDRIEPGQLPEIPGEAVPESRTVPQIIYCTRTHSQIGQERCLCAAAVCQVISL